VGKPGNMICSRTIGQILTDAFLPLGIKLRKDFFKVFHLRHGRKFQFNTKDIYDKQWISLARHGFDK
jgi:hypothetical protein